LSSDILAALDADFEPEAARLFLDLTCKYIAGARSGLGPVSTGHSPAELARRFEEPLPLDGLPLPEVIARLGRDVLPDANRLLHPMYMGHQVSGPLPAAIWVEPLISAMNNSAAVWEMSPTGTAVEQRVIRWMCDLVGYGPESGGTFCSGGTEATFTGLLAARARALPEAWENGVGADPPVVVYGEQAHYAVTRAIAELGLGLRSGILVPAGAGGPTDHEALGHTLDRLAAERRHVMAVVATAGSTPTGAFDDLERIGQLCEARGLWLHVDAAHGGSALLSETHRHRLSGLGRADSVAWDPHKMMLLPSATGMLLCRRERDLEAGFSQRAPYLFHAADGDRVPDQGVRSFQCTRRVDAIKAWVALERYGARGMARLYDQLCETTLALHDLLVAHPGFEVMHRPAGNILCFRWVTGGGDLDALNRELRERYNRSGRGWITTTLLGGRRVLRVTLMNPLTTPAHLAALVGGLAAEAAALLAGRPAGI
jgi:glutamate/tyrosine decarboxylase-like PLP-dependent enzyme